MEFCDRKTYYTDYHHQLINGVSGGFQCGSDDGIHCVPVSHLGDARPTCILPPPNAPTPPYPGHKQFCGKDWWDANDHCRDKLHPPCFNNDDCDGDKGYTCFKDLDNCKPKPSPKPTPCVGPGNKCLPGSGGLRQ